MDTLQELQSNVKKWQGAIDERKKRIATLNDEMARLVGDVIDGTDAKAKTARNKRAECLTELESLSAELSEVTRRHEAAVQAVNEYKLTTAQEVYERMDADARAKREELLAAQNVKLRFMNSGGRKGFTDATANTIKQIEVDIATAHAELTIANRHKEAAGRVVKSLREGV